MLHRLLKILSDVRLLNIILPILMIYLIVGTVAQKYIGLYQATQDIFYSPLFWIGFLPLPGMPVFVGLLMVNLTFYVFLKNPWQKEKIGTLIAHIGVLLLLFGGLYTVIFSQSGYIDLAVGEETKFVSDYHERALIIRNLDTNEVFTFNLEALEKDPKTLLSSLPFAVEIKELCQNCDIIKRNDKDGRFFGMAQHMQLTSKQLDRQNEENMAGLTFTVDKVQDNYKGTYLVLEGVPQYPEIIFQETPYRFELNKAQRPLHFTITLADFRRETHAGTALAKNYQSDILVTDHTIEWKSTIGMNKPFRYKGYTFFQSSYIETPIGDRSVLSVVQNSGRTFPYIAGLAVCLGLLLHFLLGSSHKIGKRGKR